LNHRWLLLETSGRIGLAGIASGSDLLAQKELDGARRHAQDLAPAIADFLAAAGWKAAEITAIGVSLGPGSYTGLRVGVMAAKAFAYALGCTLIGVPTFEVIAHPTNVPTPWLEVIGDALKEKLYVQRFARTGASSAWRPLNDLAITGRADWVAGLTPDVSVTGPGLTVAEPFLPPPIVRAHPEERTPHLSALLAKAIEALAGSKAGSVFALEPIYLRQSSAEEQWRARP
jgi:tRNA threonylcarbamoyladenosine biosynthesis protein TsaB